MDLVFVAKESYMGGVGVFAVEQFWFGCFYTYSYKLLR